MAKNSYIGLLDCNNFFVSCERLFRPDLKGWPTIVLSSNDGVVVARSQEVKDLGVPMGVPVFKVKDILEKNKVAAFSGNHELYRDISSRVMDTLREELDDVYQYSVDEAFFRLEGTEAGARALLSRLKALIERKVGVPVSLGAARTMTIAKYASEKEKRGTGVCLLVGKEWQAETKTLPLSEIWGVGYQTAKKMRENGLHTVNDLLSADNSRIEKLFGVHGVRLRSELSEVPAHSPTEKDGLQKSLMSTRSFSKAVTSLAEIEEALSYHANSVGEEIRDVGGVARSIRVILGTSRHGDWLLRGVVREVTLSKGTSDTRVILKAAIALAREAYDPEVPYKKAGIVLSDITSSSSLQLELFATNDGKEDDGKLMKVLDQLNSKHKESLIAVGKMKHGEGHLVSRRFRSPRYTTRWSEIIKVK